MAGVARDADPAARGAVGEFVADRGDGARLKGRTADAAAPDVDGFTGVSAGDRHDLQGGGGGGIDVRFNDGEVVAGNQREDACREGFRAFAEAQAERPVGGHVLGGEYAHSISEASNDRSRAHAVVVTRVGDDDDRAVPDAIRNGRRAQRPRGEYEGRERGDEGVTGWDAQCETSAPG